MAAYVMGTQPVGDVDRDRSARVAAVGPLHPGGRPTPGLGRALASARRGGAAPELTPAR